ncbi:MAG: NAD-dependent epimerase/dehydratase family protein [Ramlibacter sp.]|nr:NAD-dependent epimerase/dehydratase family protein [Ramlibacter sp.]
MTRLKVGLLGAGYILQAHAKALGAVASVELRAVCDLSKSRATQAAAAYGIPQVFTSLAQLLESDCDVVHVLLPPFLHEDTARQLLMAGKHLFIEKPMGLSSAQCQALVELADDRKLRLGVNHNFLFLPGYEALRRDFADGTIGTADHVTVNWLYALGLIQFGPYDNWMLGSEGNLLFELGSHLAAFATDLVGPLDELNAVASLGIELPGSQHVYRHWNVIGRRNDTAVTLNLSVAPGQPDRSVHVRGSAAAAHFDFERDIYWLEKARSNSSLFDPLHQTRSTARQIGSQGWKNLRRYLGATFKRQPHTMAFQDSISRSVAVFYATFYGAPDPRLTGQFGADVIRLCERIVSAANAAPAAPPRPIRTHDVSALAQPTVLIVGGTGFIGKRLVKSLAERGVGVRVLSRSVASARLALSGLPVDVVQGSHDDRAALDIALQGIEVVYHLAKATGQRWADYVSGDVEPTQVLADAALAHGVKRFIYTGTIDSHDSANAHAVITSDTPLDAHLDNRNLYARSKATCEAMLTRMHKERGLPLVIFRPGVVIGVGSPPAHWGVGMFHSDTRAQLWGDGQTKLPLVLVDDVAEGLALGMTAPGIVGQTFLLTDAPLLTAREYVQEVSQASSTRISASPTPIWRFFALDVAKEAVKHLIRHPNRRVPSYRDWDCRAHRARYDNTKTRQVLGWAPVGTREALVSAGIVAAVKHYFR